SARLRAAVRTDAPPRGGDLSVFDLPKLPGAAPAQAR
ncbi:MAG: 16S rRNA (cytosine(1402)-N(4))-methyltransferase, partial [Mesorhizobium sp.]